MTIDAVLSGDERWVVECGDALAALKTMPDSCVDAVVTDPPYGLGTREPTVDEIIAYLTGASLDLNGDFMARDWLIPTVTIWREAFRVLKPGGYLLSFAGTRTVDLIGIGIRAAGFEPRDELSWTYGQGMPHGINVSKAIDKKLGAARKVVGQRQLTGNAAQTTKEKCGTYAAGTDARGVAPKTVDVTAPGSPEAEQWDGWHTGLKPCREPVIVARKPFKGSIVANILKHGTGAIHVDACRVGDGHDKGIWPATDRASSRHVNAALRDAALTDTTVGRWPGNWLLSHAEGCEEGDCMPWCPVGMLDASEGITTSHPAHIKATHAAMGYGGGNGAERIISGDTGYVSRYFNTFPYEPPWFYEGKADRSEREKGCEHLPPGRTTDGRAKVNDTPYLRDATERRNIHPTVKPIRVMQWLCRLVAQPGGVVLDPFCGSGSTGVAALAEGFRFVGVELDPHHCEIARARITGDNPLFNRLAGAK